jgi:hypothetical protein
LFPPGQRLFVYQSIVHGCPWNPPKTAFFKGIGVPYGKKGYKNQLCISLLEDCYELARNQPGARWFSLFVGCLLDKASNPSRFTAAPFLLLPGATGVKKSAPG